MGALNMQFHGCPSRRLSVSSFHRLAWPRKLHAQPIYLESEKADLLDELTADTRIPKAVLLREAVDDLLIKHGKLKKPTNSKK